MRVFKWPACVTCNHPVFPDGPTLQGESIMNLTGTGKKVDLECRAEANPAPVAEAVRWKRLSRSGMDYYPITNFPSNRQTQLSVTSTKDSLTGIRCNKVRNKYICTCIYVRNYPRETNIPKIWVDQNVE